MSNAKRFSRFAGLALALAAFPVPAQELSFTVQGGGDDGAGEALTGALENASLLHAAQAERGEGEAGDPRDVLAAARADYARMVNALYAEGYYGGVVRILVDGREAASMSPFAAPAHIGKVEVSVDPGPRFRFGRVSVAPLAPGTTLPSAFRSGEVAASATVRAAVKAAVSDWRDAGHAKAALASQRVTANHPAQTLDADIRLAPGPRVILGDLVQTTPSAVRAERVQRIAGLPTGEVYAPAKVEAAANRLRRTGAFSSVAITEAEALGPDGTMDIAVALADQKPRRFGVGAELASFEGLTLSGYWMHRNLFGGAERFRFDAELSGLDAELDGLDAEATARLDIPAAFGTDNNAFVLLEGGYIKDPGYTIYGGGGGAGVHRIFAPGLEGEAAFAYHYVHAEDAFGERDFSFLSLPASLTWDKRDNPLDATSGFYVKAEAEPFYEFEGETFGARGWLDARSYLGFNDGDLVLAGRVQAGYVAAPSAADVPSDFLFYSGGGGTVRGFPYQSMGVELGNGDIVGGMAFLGGSAEVRYKVTDAIGVVGFADAAQVGAESFLDGSDWQVGAGVGLRYDTGMGPIRLDVAVPVSGPGASLDSYEDVQLYLGIGQAF
ncbi:MAG: hypothetical protein CSA74_09455 [Rhodobacterales bacterium]|nr:MAG: hypothetical protein CSA74_09455 [Rhodobacterales bacterium]